MDLCSDIFKVWKYYLNIGKFGTQKEGEANNSIGILSEKEKLIFLTALYWGEGSKGDFGLSNSDPDLIKVVVKGLKEVFNINNDRLRISIRTYKDLDQNKCLKF